MTSREKILSSIKKNQPSGQVNDHVFSPEKNFDCIDKFKSILTSIGGEVIEVRDQNEMITSIQKTIPESSNKRIISPSLSEFSGKLAAHPNMLADVDVAIIKGEFGVGENGAIWVVEESMGDRALPFICQYLTLFMEKSSIVHTMHDAYEKIGNANQEFGTFIAGPSKTADIEQSLVLGAHGAKGLTVYLIG